jgi:NADH:ubiquinone oxidoreductase subunit E
MVINLKNETEVSAVVQTAIKQHGATHEALIPILTEVNNKLGFLPEHAMTEIGRSLRLPNSQIVSTASFYRMLSTKPRGKHVIKFCESAPCHIMGGRKLWQALKKELGLEAGETSADGQWTLLTTSCPGICGVGPVLMINDDVYGNVVPDKIPEILAQYKGGK